MDYYTNNSVSIEILKDDIVFKGIDEEGKVSAYYAMPRRTVRPKSRVQSPGPNHVLPVK